MSGTKVRLTIELEIDAEMLEQNGLSAEDVVDGIYIRDDDVCDGFQITTAINGFDCTTDFFLQNGILISKELVKREEGVNQEVYE